MDTNPKLKGGAKGAPPPYPLNSFTRQVLFSLGRSLLEVKLVHGRSDVAGEEFERLFAKAIGAEWTPSNFGLDDVQLLNTCWGAKTVKASNPITQRTIRLISGRNSPVFSFSESNLLDRNPQDIGDQVLAIWNARVDEIYSRFRYARTVVMVKGASLSTVVLFESQLLRFPTENFTWRRNKNNNLEGIDAMGLHRFTWQPHGSQFTVVEEIPASRHVISLHPPESVKPLDASALLATLGYDDSWIKIG